MIIVTENTLSDKLHNTRADMINYDCHNSKYEVMLKSDLDSCYTTGRVACKQCQLLFSSHRLQVQNPAYYYNTINWIVSGHNF